MAGVSVPLLLRDADPNIRQLSLKNLLHSENPEKLAILEVCLSEETDVQLKYEMRKALNELKSLKQPQILDSRPQIDDSRISKALESDDLEQVKRAFLYILKARNLQYFPQMQKIEKENQSSFFKVCNIRMRLLQGPQSLNEIMEYLQDPDPRVLSTALEALAEIGNTKSLARIAEFTNHSNNRVQATALKALYKLGNQGALHLFEQMAGSKYPAYRDSCCYAIAALKLEDAIPLLEKFLKDPVESVRIKALRGLESLAHEGSESAKVVLEGNTQFHPRLLHGVKEKGHSGSSPTAIAQESAALHSDTPSVRSEAMEQITRDSSEEQISSILDRLKLEKDPGVIARGLAALSHSKATEKLKMRIFTTFLSHEDNRVRANALEGMGRWLPDDQKDFFLPHLDDPNNRVRANAILALASAKDFEASYLESIYDCLKILLKDTRENYQLSGLFCMGSIQNLNLLPLIQTPLDSSFTKVREKAWEILENWSLDSEEALEVLNSARQKIKGLEEEAGPAETQYLETMEAISNQIMAADDSKADQSRTVEKSADAKKAPVGFGTLVFHPALHRGCMVIFGLIRSVQWFLIPLSVDVNFLLRIASLVGLALSASWVLLGLFLSLLPPGQTKNIPLLIGIDVGFTLVVAVSMLLSEHPVVGNLHILLSLVAIAYIGFGFKKLSRGSPADP